MSDRRELAVRMAPLALLLALAVAWLVPQPAGMGLASTADDGRARAFAEALDDLPDRPTVLVGFDPDLGTYAEIRPSVRTALADLLARDARLALVSLTPEGRALAVAERDRLAQLDANPSRFVDLGFVPGAEAALVALARGPRPAVDDDSALARSIADEGVAAFDAIVVVGGNDLGPRSWVEQVRPRLDAPIPLLAIAPTVLLPELLPYLDDGSVAAALATPRDGAAYRAGAELGSLARLTAADDVPGPPVLVGVLAAIVVLGAAWLGRGIGAVRRTAGESRP